MGRERWLVLLTRAQLTGTESAVLGPRAVTNCSIAQARGGFRMGGVLAWVSGKPH